MKTFELTCPIRTRPPLGVRPPEFAQADKVVVVRQVRPKYGPTIKCWECGEYEPLSEYVRTGHGIDYLCSSCRRSA